MEKVKNMGDGDGIGVDGSSLGDNAGVTGEGTIGNPGDGTGVSNTGGLGAVGTDVSDSPPSGFSISAPTMGQVIGAVITSAITGNIGAVVGLGISTASNTIASAIGNNGMTSSANPSGVSASSLGAVGEGPAQIPGATGSIAPGGALTDAAVKTWLDGVGSRGSSKADVFRFVNDNNIPLPTLVRLTSLDEASVSNYLREGYNQLTVATDDDVPLIRDSRGVAPIAGTPTQRPTPTPAPTPGGAGAPAPAPATRENLLPLIGLLALGASFFF